MRVCIGIDVGRSATKVFVADGDRRESLAFPSSVCPAIRITDESAARRAKADTVLVNGQPYFVGDTALVQCRDDMLGGLTDDWATSDLHQALIVSAIARLGAIGVDADGALIVVGLPARLYATQRKAYANAVAELLPGAQIKVVPQSMGPFYAMLFDDKAREVAGVVDGSWALIEVGQFTTDFALIERGHVVERAFNSTDGMRVAAEQLQRLVLEAHSISISLVEASNLLAQPTLRMFGRELNVAQLVSQSVQPLARAIMEKAGQLFGESLRAVDGVRLAGGGAQLILDGLPQGWPSVDAPAGFVCAVENSRMAVAEGFCRFAQGLETMRQAQVAASAEQVSGEAAPAEAEAA